jgi:hypothetical protein
LVKREERVVGEDREGPEGRSLEVDPEKHESCESHLEDDPTEEKRSDAFAEREEERAGRGEMRGALREALRRSRGRDSRWRSREKGRRRWR